MLPEHLLVGPWAPVLGQLAHTSSLGETSSCWITAMRRNEISAGSLDRSLQMFATAALLTTGHVESSMHLCCLLMVTQKWDVYLEDKLTNVNTNTCSCLTSVMHTTCPRQPHPSKCLIPLQM